MIECKNISKKYGGDTPFFALRDVNLKINTGQFMAIVGKSGSGKSTLLNVIGLIDNVSNGKIVIDDNEIELLSKKEQASLRNKKIGYIFQSFYLEPSYSVYKNVEMPLLIGGMQKKERKMIIDECLEKVDMKDKINNPIANLSGGEKQRVCIARALVNNPDIILADEPCGNLDSENTEIVMAILEKLNMDGRTIVLVTHSMEDAVRASRIVELKDGKIVKDEKKM